MPCSGLYPERHSLQDAVCAAEFGSNRFSLSPLPSREGTTPPPLVLTHRHTTALKLGEDFPSCCIPHVFFSYPTTIPAFRVPTPVLLRESSYFLRANLQQLFGFDDLSELTGGKIFFCNSEAVRNPEISCRSRRRITASDSEVNEATPDSKGYSKSDATSAYSESGFLSRRV